VWNSATTVVLVAHQIVLTQIELAGEMSAILKPAAQR